MIERPRLPRHATATHPRHDLLPYGGRLARFGLGAAAIAAPANLGEPVLCHDAGLLNGQFPVQSQRGFAGLPAGRLPLC